MVWNRGSSILRRSSSSALWRSHCQICARQISAVAASSIRLNKGTQPVPASQAVRYKIPTRILLRNPASVIVPFGTFRRSSAATVISSRRTDSWLGAGILLSNTSRAMGTSPGCATQVPSWPSPASRSLSARTLARAISLAFGSFLIGIWAAMPPIAKAPRRWQVLMTSRL